MPSVIYNKQTGEVLKNNPENRIQTFRVICKGDYSVYKTIYEEVRYGNIKKGYCSFESSSDELIKAAGLYEEHKRIVTEKCDKELSNIDAVIADLEDLLNLATTEESQDCLESAISEKLEEIDYFNSIKNRL